MAKTELSPTRPPEPTRRRSPLRSLAEQPVSGTESNARGYFGEVSAAYLMLRHAAVTVAAVWAVIADVPSNSTHMALRIAAALTVIVIDVAPIGDAPQRRGRSADSLLGMASLVGLGVINPAALVPIAVALTAGYLCFLGPVWMHAPAAMVQLGGTALVGASSSHPAQLWLLLPVMVLTDVSKVLGAHLIDGRLRVVDQHFDTMIEESRTTSWSLAERLRHQSDHDALTGLPNRARLETHLLGGMDEMASSGHSFALMLMDLTRFRQVNDALGHRVGDRLLVAISRRLRAELADACGIIGRWGGDEFALVSLAVSNEEEALALARRATGVLERPFKMDGIAVQCSANLGVAVFPAHAKDAEELLNAADEALFRAKRSGQPVELSRAEHHRGSLRQVTLLGELSRAMDAGELSLYYQPVLDLDTERIVQVEALVRWQHREHGLMLTGEFLETVESSHMIHPLTRWIVTRALRDTQAMHEAGLDLGVAVNVSVRNLQDPDLATFFENLSPGEDFQAERLQLEITETELIDDGARAIDVLARLRSLGVSVAVDDFGVGHASLAYLKHLPVSHLKIDRQFVAAITSDEHDAAIVRSTIEMAHRLGLTVTAEGATDRATLLALREMNCDVAQGFYISEPVPLDQLVPLVAHLDATAAAILSGADSLGPHAS